jgi:hypothetical protein
VGTSVLVNSGKLVRQAMSSVAARLGYSLSASACAVNRQQRLRVLDQGRSFGSATMSVTDAAITELQQALPDCQINK